MSLFTDDGDQTALGLTDDFDESSFLNESVLLSADNLLKNIRDVQQENNVKLSDSIVDSLGRCSLDVEMETGDGGIIVSSQAKTA